VQDLARQAPLDREDGTARFPHTDVLGRGVAAPAQVTDQAHQPPLVVKRAPGTGDQLDDELIIASGDGKGRTGLPAQRLINDQNAAGASKPRHRVQEQRIGLN
jgi:hypothetical protein